MPLLIVLTGVGASILGVWALIRLIRGEPAIFKQVVAAGVLEVCLLLACVAGVIRQIGGRLDGDPVVFWGYLITALFILPVAVAWAFADRSRASSAAMAVAGATIAVMAWRTWQVAEL